MALNYRRWSFERDRFDDVGIERADIDDFEIDPEAMGERLFHPLAFTRAQQRVIDEDAFESLADRAIDERCGDRRIDAARERHQDAIAIADARANRGNLTI